MVVKIKKEREMVVCYPVGDVPMMRDPDNPGTFIPDDTWLITDDDEPVDSLVAEKERRLLTGSLYSSWTWPDVRSFMVMANVGLFFSPTEPPSVPTLWKGDFEDWKKRVFLRWCDKDGNVIPTGAESAEQSRQLADDEKQRADDEKRRADEEKRRGDRLAAKLRALGIDPTGNGSNGK